MFQRSYRLKGGSARILRVLDVADRAKLRQALNELYEGRQNGKVDFCPGLSGAEDATLHPVQSPVGCCRNHLPDLIPAERHTPMLTVSLHARGSDLVISTNVRNILNGRS